jgi:hypothetical protein
MLSQWATRKLQFRTLYRVFLLRVVDLNLMSADADPSKLITQFATMFATISLFIALPAMIGLMGGGRTTGTNGWTAEHFLIETSMTIAGLVAVLNWDAALPDRQDVLILAPLPVRNSTLLLAKIAGLLAAPGLAIVALNMFCGVLWPVGFRAGGGGFLWLLRSWGAYWTTILIAGAFVVFAILSVQGVIANLLPRQYFLRVSAFLQAALLCLLLSVYFLGPSLESPAALAAPENQRMLACLPSYWFFGLFQQLNGSMHPALTASAARAWIGFFVASGGAVGSLLLAYFRTMPKIIEQAEIVPRRSESKWSLPLGSSLQTALTLFTVRTLLRSRQHRMVMSFYLGIGLTIVVGYIDILSDAGRPKAAGISTPFLAASMLLMILTLLAIRVVASIPITLRAHWIIRVTQSRPANDYRKALRFSWMVLAVMPVMLVVAPLLLIERYPWRPAVGHLGILFALGVLLVEICIYSFPKIPFTCSYLPGKAKIHFVFWAVLMLFIRLLYDGALFEQAILHHALSCALGMGTLVLASLGLRRLNTLHAGTELRFEEEYSADLVSLNIRLSSQTG